MTSEDRIPVVVAAGQVTSRDTAEIVSALDLAERAARAALDEVPGLAARIDRVSVVNIMSRVGPAPASRLAARLGIEPAVREHTAVGGNTPQWLVNRAAAAIAAGELEATLIAGAEAMRSGRELRNRGEAGSAGGGGSGDEPDGRTGAGPDPVVGDDRSGISTAETNAGMVIPSVIYPMFESVIAHRAGRSFAEHRAVLGRIMAPFTEVAAKHPHAWFPEARTPEEIAEPGSDNRMVAEPYTKRMNAVLNVDQGAAVIVCSLAAARAAGVADRAVFVWSGAEANEVWFPTARPDLGASTGIEAAGRAAFEAAGIGPDDLALIDLYSCFPVAVEMGAAALGLALDDPRGLTVTGGLPYFGGPGNNYVTHSIATLTDRLRSEGGIGLATALGWYVTKHAVGIYGAEPPPRGFSRPDTSAAQAAIDATALEVAEAVDDGGVPATVEAATVVHDRTEAVSAAPVIARLDDGRRVAAMCAAPADELASLAGVNLVGQRVAVAGSPPRYRLA